MTHAPHDTSDPAADVAAAVVALITPRAAKTVADCERTSLWRDRGALVRAPLMPGRGAWRASGLPS